VPGWFAGQLTEKRRARVTLRLINQILSKEMRRTRSIWWQKRKNRHRIEL